MDQSALISLYRNGEVIAHALVDSDYAPWLNQWAWGLHDGRPHEAGYACRHYHVEGKQRRIYMHRAILGLETGDLRLVDHTNGNTLDNRRENLRTVTNAENHQNVGIARNNKSGYRGVYKGRSGWIAVAKLNGQDHRLGTYRTPEEAAEVVSKWREQHMPFSVERGRIGAIREQESA